MQVLVQLLVIASCAKKYQNATTPEDPGGFGRCFPRCFRWSSWFHEFRMSSIDIDGTWWHSSGVEVPTLEERDRLLVQGAFIALRGSDNLVSEHKWMWCYKVCYSCNGRTILVECKKLEGRLKLVHRWCVLSCSGVLGLLRQRISWTLIYTYFFIIYIYTHFDNICPCCVEYVDSSVFLPIVTALEERIQSSGVGLRGASSCWGTPWWFQFVGHAPWHNVFLRERCAKMWQGHFFGPSTCPVIGYTY